MWLVGLSEKVGGRGGNLLCLSAYFTQSKVEMSKEKKYGPSQIIRIKKVSPELPIPRVFRNRTDEQ